MALRRGEGRGDPDVRRFVDPQPLCKVSAEFEDEGTLPKFDQRRHRGDVGDWPIAPSEIQQHQTLPFSLIGRAAWSRADVDYAILTSRR